MKTKLARAILLAGALHSSMGLGLGLGDIKIDSGINERLDAEILLSKSKGLDASQVLVSLASKADFDRAGIERDYFLNNLRFDVVLEPFLNFLIEVRWPSGRLLREYTVLLDLPTFSALPARLINQSAPPPSQSKSPNSGGDTRAVAKLSPSRSADKGTVTSDVGQPQPTAQASADSITVAANDTLWEIALQVKPRGVTVHQTMLALQQLNPRAFINNNINLLKKGAVLRVPDFAGIAGQDALQSRRSVSDQQQQWQQKNLSDAPAGVIDARDQRAAAKQDSSQSGHLQLAVADSNLTGAASTRGQRDSKDNNAAATDTSVSSGVAANSNLASEIEQLRSHLAVSLENLDKAGVENETMASRLDAMESQMDDLEQLVTLKDRELQSMRGSLAARRDALQAAAETGVDPASIEGEVPATPLDDSQAVIGSTASAVEAAQSSEPQTKADVIVPPSAANNAAESGILASLANTLSLSTNWVIAILGGFAALLIGFIALLFGRKNNDYEATVFESDDGSESFVTDEMDESFSEPAEDAFSAADDVAADDTYTDSTLDDLEDIASTLSTEDSSDGVEVEPSVDRFAEQPTYSAEEPSTSASESSDASITGAAAVVTGVAAGVATGVAAGATAGSGASDQDPLAEADIYLAYGRHEQAVSMLQGALAVDPLNTELKLKLLEVHVDAGNVEGFKAVCGPLLNDDPSMNAEVETLLESVEDLAAWWPEGVVAAPSDTFLEDFQANDSDLALDLDMDIEGGAAALGLSGQFDDLPDVAPDLQLAYDADSDEAKAGLLANSDSEQSADYAEASNESNDEFNKEPMSQDEIGTKLDLARAYIDMGDVDGARDILDEVLNEGSIDQQEQATSMLKLIA